MLEVGKYQGIKVIHKYLFAEIDDFASKSRTVNIFKGNFRLAPVLYLEMS